MSNTTRKIVRIAASYFLTISFLSATANGYENIYVHPAINENGLIQSNFVVPGTSMISKVNGKTEISHNLAEYSGGFL